MKSTAMTVVLVMVISLATLFVVGDACDNVQTQSRNEACALLYDGVPEKYNICMKALENTPDTPEVIVYALEASRLAKLNLETSTTAFKQLMGNTSLPADDRDKYKYCVGQYAVARKLLDGVIKDIKSCMFEHIREKFNAMDVNLWNCLDDLLESPLPSWPLLVKMVKADSDATEVADGLFSFITKM